MLDVNNWWHKIEGWDPKNKALVVFEFYTVRLPWDVGSTEADPYHDGPIGIEIRLLSDPNFSGLPFRKRLQLAD